MSLLAQKDALVDEEDDCGGQSAFATTAPPPAAPQPLLRRVDPRLRLMASVFFALLVVGLNRLGPLSAALALAAATAAAARLEPGPTLRRMAALEGFMLFVLLLLPFTIPGTPLLSLGGIEASREGFLRAIGILLKSSAVMLMILALLGSMEPVELGHAMARLRLPEKFVQLFQFTLRYIEVLGREYRRLRLAMKARGFRMRCDLHTWRSIGYLFGMLLVQSIERSERIAAAMRCRGFQGKFHPLTDPAALGRRDHAFAGLSLAAGLALAILEHL